MSVRPDLAACWLFRVAEDGRIEILLIRRAEGRLYPGLWQCVTGKIEANERILDAALREVHEETGLGYAELEVVFDTDLINWFHAPDLDTILCEAVFAARVRPAAVATLSDEHDALQWCSPDEARQLVTWRAYVRGIDFVEWLVANPAKESAFRIG